MECDQCEFLYINGLGCHETGYQNAEQYRGMDGTERPRRFTVRKIAWDTGDANTVGEFQAYASRASALAACKRAAA